MRAHSGNWHKQHLILRSVTSCLPEDLLGASHSTSSVKYLESGTASVSKNKIFQTAILSFSNIQIFSIINESGLSVNP